MKSEQLVKYGIVIPTGEYVGGYLGGFGLGIMAATFVLSPVHRITVPWVWFLILGFITIGSLLARAAQRKRFLKGDANVKPVA